jgi:hypothetical protein|tara:strand:+ start:787 stop:1113 length:327 start_codon:yes stop_codon:yes gene_type:complete
MAQDFTRYIARDTGTSGSTIFTANSNDAVTSIRLANITASAITADVFITVSSADYYLVKSVSMPAGSSIELIDGGSRIVVASGDALKVDCNTDNALDVWVSVVDAISA